MSALPDNPIALAMLWQSAIVPFCAALAVLAGAHALPLRWSAMALAVSAGFLASFFAALHAHWSPLPHVALDWTPWIALAGLPGVLAAERLRAAGLRFALRLALALAATALVVWPALASFGAQKAAIVMLAGGLLIAVVWTLVAPVAHGGASRPLLLAAVAGGAAIALLLDSSQSVGRLSGALAAALAACAVFNLPRTRTAFSPAAAAITVLLLGVLLVNAHVYAGFPLGYVALIVGALLADPGLAAVHRLRRSGGDGPSWLPRAVLTALPLMATVAMAARAMQGSGEF